MANCFAVEHFCSRLVGREPKEKRTASLQRFLVGQVAERDISDLSDLSSRAKTILDCGKKSDGLLNGAMKWLFAFIVATLLAVVSTKAQQREILDKSAWITMSSGLEIFNSSPIATSVWAKRARGMGTLTLAKGRGIDIKSDYKQLLDQYKLPGVQILSSSLKGNTFTLETRTGTSSVYVHRRIKSIYVPQESGSLPIAYTALLDLSSLLDSSSAQALRKAFDSFKPKSTTFQDAVKPFIFVSDPVRAVTTSSTSYVVKGLSTDNVSPATLQVRVWPPNTAGFGVWQPVKLGGAAKFKQWTYRLPMQSAKGEWRMQIRVADAAENTSSSVAVSITRK